MDVLNGPPQGAAPVRRPGDILPDRGDVGRRLPPVVPGSLAAPEGPRSRPRRPAAPPPLVPEPVDDVANVILQTEKVADALGGVQGRSATRPLLPARPSLSLSPLLLTFLEPLS